MSDHTIWQYTGSGYGVTITITVLRRGQRIFLVAKGSGYGCHLGPREVEISGDGRYALPMGRCGGEEIEAAFAIRNWIRTPFFLAFDLGAWARVGERPFLPPGGIWLKVVGSMEERADAAALGEYLRSGYANDLRAHGIEVADAVPAGA
jgi:hypothetical protein